MDRGDIVTVTRGIALGNPWSLGVLCGCPLGYGAGERCGFGGWPLAVAVPVCGRLWVCLFAKRCFNCWRIGRALVYDSAYTSK